ncbi:uncharacterized protein METZ01_LOCUS467642 [marine metagenome]|uniref:Uncharacterized protein n=1 Tax=marine metagenome TaxID=408172 RepID=A0A383B5X6_9ZZZZ
MEELSLYLNNKFNDLKNSLGNIGENKLLLITSIKVMDEYFETKKKIDKQKIELNKITERFKELKSLVYKYKEDKEKEIMNLKEDQAKVKSEIDSQKINYENLVDRATLEIESFIKKHEVDTKVQ